MIFFFMFIFWFFQQRFYLWLYSFEFWELEVMLFNLSLSIWGEMFLLHFWFCDWLNFWYGFLVIIFLDHFENCFSLLFQFLFLCCIPICYHILDWCWWSIRSSISKILIRDPNPIYFLSFLYFYFNFINFTKIS